MRSLEEEKGEENAQNVENVPLNLFEVLGVKSPELWQCISYVAPSNERKKWKAKDAIATYCEVCKTQIPYDSKKNSKGVSRHMKKYHQHYFLNSTSRRRV